MKTLFLSSKQLADVFQVKESAITTLAHSGLIPNAGDIVSNAAVFNADYVIAWLRAGPCLPVEDSAIPIGLLRKQYASLFPGAIKALSDIDKQLCPGARQSGSTCQRCATSAWASCTMRATWKTLAIQQLFNLLKRLGEYRIYFSVSDAENLALYHFVAGVGFNEALVN
jgi:hypothetical protein